MNKNQVALNTIYNENCLVGMKRISDETIDMTLTSPPYDNLRTYNDSLEWSFDIFKLIAKELYRVTKQGGVLVWVVGDATIKGSETGTSFMQALYFKELGFRLYDTMFYEKASRIPTEGRYYNTVEYMFVLSKGKPKTLNFLCDHKNVTEGQRRVKDTCINKGVNKKKSGEYLITPAYSRRSNLWRYGTGANQTGHPAPFPLKLATDHIVSWTEENDLVLDPFMGSGTTAVSCIDTNRNYIGFEKEEKYYNIILDRLAKNKPTKVMPMNGASQLDIKREQMPTQQNTLF